MKQSRWRCRELPKLIAENAVKRGFEPRRARSRMARVGHQRPLSCLRRHGRSAPEAVTHSGERRGGRDDRSHLTQHVFEMSVFTFRAFPTHRACDMREPRAGTRILSRTLDDLLKATRDSAKPDEHFEVAWLPANEVCEGSRLRGFLTVQIVGFEQKLPIGTGSKGVLSAVRGDAQRAGISQAASGRDECVTL